jgi:CYTH domain-containing protein
VLGQGDKAFITIKEFKQRHARFEWEKEIPANKQTIVTL